MTAKDILEQLKSLGRESYEKLLMKNCGVKEPCFGVPFAPDYIRKVRQRGTIGKKRKTAKC